MKPKPLTNPQSLNLVKKEIEPQLFSETYHDCWILHSDRTEVVRDRDGTKQGVKDRHHHIVPVSFPYTLVSRTEIPYHLNTTSTTWVPDNR